MSGLVNFTLFLKPYVSTFGVFQSFSSVKRRSFYAVFRLIVCGANRRSTCHKDQSRPPHARFFFQGTRLSKFEVGMTKNAGFVWTEDWNGGQNAVFRNIRIRVVGAWIGKPGEKLLLLQYRTELPLFLFQWLLSAFVAEWWPLSTMCLFRSVLLAALKGHTGHPSGLEWTILWR